MTGQGANPILCKHFESRLVSKGGDAPEWVHQSMWRRYWLADGQLVEQCLLCRTIRVQRTNL